VSVPEPAPPASTGLTLATLRPWLEGLAVVALLGLGYLWYRQIGASAVARAAEAADRHALDSLARVAPKVDTAYVHDTIHVNHTTTVYQLQRDTLLKNIHDTVEVIRFVAAADSAVHACSVLRTDCDKRHTVDSAQAALWRGMYRAEAARRPSPLLTWGERALFAVAGYGIRAITAK